MRAWLLLASLMVGCGPSSYGDFRDQLVDRACSRAVRCGTIGDSERARCGVPPALALTAAGPLDVGTAASAGRLSFDSPSASDCLDAMEGAPCDHAAAARHLERHCHHVVAPGVQTGGACDTDEECLGGRCVRDAAGCHGTCVAFAAPGAPCQPDGGAPEDTCDSTVQYCGADRPDGGLFCERHKQADQACAADDECAFALVCRATCKPLPLAGAGMPCADDTPCADGLRCLDGACVRLAGNRAACADAAACADGLTCIGWTTSSAGTCQPWRDVGQGCVNGGDGVNGSDGSGCPVSQRCDAPTSLCASVPATAAGPHQSCVKLACGDRLYCARGSTTCEYRSGLDGACRSNETSMCEDGLTCDPKRLVCVSGASCE